MANDNLSLKEVCAELNMTEAAVRAAMQAGRLLPVPGESPPKFSRQMVDQFKSQIPTDATLAMDDAADQDSSHLDLGAAGARDEDENPNEITEFAMEVEDDEATASRIDLAEVEAEAGADESDQTSVLPLGEEVADEGGQKEAVFDFAEEDLGLADEGGGGRIDLAEVEAEAGADEADQTSTFPVGETVEEGGEQEGQVLDFAEEDLGIAEDESADTSEAKTEDSDTSADILEIADGMDEDSSSDALVAVSDDSDSESAALGGSDVVAEMLEAGVEESEDELDTIDLDDMEPSGEGSDDLMTVVEDETVGSSADTAPMGAGEAISADEAETVSLDSEDMDTEAVTDATEGAFAGATTEALGETADALGEQAPAYAQPEAVQEIKSLWANAMLIVAVVLVAFGGFVMLCEAAGATANPVVEFVRDFVSQHF